MALYTVYLLYIKDRKGVQRLQKHPERQISVCVSMCITIIFKAVFCQFWSVGIFVGTKFQCLLSLLILKLQDGHIHSQFSILHATAFLESHPRKTNKQTNKKKRKQPGFQSIKIWASCWLFFCPFVWLPKMLFRTELGKRKLWELTFSGGKHMTMWWA